MLERDGDDENAFLVEFNTIASGAGALCAGVTEMHGQLALRNLVIFLSWDYFNEFSHGLFSVDKISYRLQLIVPDLWFISNEVDLVWELVWGWLS